MRYTNTLNQSDIGTFTVVDDANATIDTQYNGIIDASAVSSATAKAAAIALLNNTISMQMTLLPQELFRRDCFDQDISVIHQAVIVHCTNTDKYKSFHLKIKTAKKYQLWLLPADEKAEAES